MNIFLWEDVVNLTNNYHDGGGLVVIAESLERARELISQNCPSDCDALKLDPDLVTKVDFAEEKIYIFRDAGCC